jgi:hypothetical protein
LGLKTSEFEKNYMNSSLTKSPEEVMDDFEEIAIADILFRWEPMFWTEGERAFPILSMEPYWLRNVLSKAKSWD